MQFEGPQISVQNHGELKVEIFIWTRSRYWDTLNNWNMSLNSLFTRQKIDKNVYVNVQIFVDFLTKIQCVLFWNIYIWKFEVVRKIYSHIDNFRKEVDAWLNNTKKLRCICFTLEIPNHIHFGKSQSFSESKKMINDKQACLTSIYKKIENGFFDL